jgi:hypothetical protein
MFRHAGTSGHNQVQSELGLARVRQLRASRMLICQTCTDILQRSVINNNKFNLKLVALGSVGGQLVLKHHQGVDVGDIC